MSYYDLDPSSLDQNRLWWDFERASEAAYRSTGSDLDIREWLATQAGSDHDKAKVASALRG